LGASPSQIDELVKQKHQSVLEKAIEVFHNPELREFIVDVRKKYDQIIDTVNLDSVVSSGWVKDQIAEAEKLVGDFRQWMEEHKNEIIRYTGCNAKKIKVIPCLISSHFTSSPKDFNHHYPVILHIGTAWNKNLSNHIQAVKDIPCLLKIVGKLSENHRFELINAGIDFENVVHLSDHEILSLYHSCDILLFASLAEGFGLPILEAQYVGRAVITSNRGAMDEVAGKGALLVDPLSVESIRDGLISIIHNDSVRELCIEEGFKNTYKYGSHFILAQHDLLFSSILS
jgi:glycosyltransferase involved in cell wall biosynthesis